MVTVKKNTQDNTTSLINKGVNEILRHFNNGGSDHFFSKKGVRVIYRNDYRIYPRECLDLAMKRIAAAGYYVWTIYGCFGRNCELDLVYRITTTRVAPTPGCKLVYTP